MEKDRNNDVFSKVVRAGKRTYFFDVKATRSNDLYLTLTESKKVFHDGKESFQKHKVFLYKEDFDKFQDGLEEALSKIKELQGTGDYQPHHTEGDHKESVDKLYKVTFDDL